MTKLYIANIIQKCRWHRIHKRFLYFDDYFNSKEYIFNILTYLHIQERWWRMVLWPFQELLLIFFSQPRSKDVQNFFHLCSSATSFNFVISYTFCSSASNFNFMICLCFSALPFFISKGCGNVLKIVCDHEMFSSDWNHSTCVHFLFFLLPNVDSKELLLILFLSHVPKIFREMNTISMLSEVKPLFVGIG